MSCKQCGLRKKTIKALKMHIKLLHLKSGKFQCARCQFTANMLNSVFTHYKIQHPEAENADYVERSTEGQNFSQDFWKEEWGIPTVQERLAMIESGQHGIFNIESDDVRKRHLNIDTDGGSMPGPKSKKRSFGKGPRRTKTESLTSISNSVETSDGNWTIIDAPVPATYTRKTKDFSIQEISPFESIRTYKCEFCSKRCQDLERMERHLREEHPNKDQKEAGFKILTRDQVVDLLTNSSGNRDSLQNNQFACYYCEEVVGTIFEVRNHFEAKHDDNFKARRQDSKKVIPGYLECQVCGHLTPGYDRSKQRVHFHEEHPTETTVNASKYVSKVRQNLSVLAGPEGNINKFDPSKYVGVTISCPKPCCDFETVNMAAMNNHLRRHTQTFKCGHCGKAFPNSAEFHEHSALMHGNKIPDQVKDPEAEAEFEALRGLVEANLERQKRPAEDPATNEAKKCRLTENDCPKLPTARKSTTRCAITKNIARKSTTSLLKPTSIYGLPFEPFDLSTVTTKMSIGGLEMTLNAAKMSEIINLKPNLKIYKMS